MNLILSIVLTIIIIMMYMLMIQIFTVLFRITGLTKEKARFQVISLLTNAGFSTKESELITSDHSRRKIAKCTMITGTIFNVLIVSLLINILFNIKLDSEMESLLYLLYSVLAFIGLIIIIRLPIFRRSMEKLIEGIATRVRMKNNKENIITELDAYGNSSIVEVFVVNTPKILDGRSIFEAELKSRYNITLLLIERNNRVLEVTKDTMIVNNDRIVLFGKKSNIEEVFSNKVSSETIDESKINNISIIDNYGSNAMVSIEVKKVPPMLVNTKLKDSRLKRTFGINVIMLTTDNKSKITDGETIINVGDRVVLFGPYEHIKLLFLDDNNKQS